MNSYRRLCTEFYDIDKPKPPDDAFAFYRGRAGEAKGPILEPMCGPGRFLLPLLAEGFDIDGADASPNMLQACRAKAQAGVLLLDFTSNSCINSIYGDATNW